MYASSVSVAALQSTLQRRFISWKRIAHTMDGVDAFLMPSAQRCLKVAVNFAANICATHEIDPAHILLKLDDKQRSDGHVVKGIGNPMTEIYLRSRLFSNSLLPECLFVIAHEFGHIVNGDTDDAKIKRLIERAVYEEMHPPQLTVAERRDRASRDHYAELAADAFAAKAFSELTDGIDAGVSLMKRKIRDEQEISTILTGLLRQPARVTSADYRYYTHPSPQLRIRMLKRLAGAPQ